MINSKGVDMINIHSSNLKASPDQVPGLPGDIQPYGDALPARLNPRVGVATVLAALPMIEEV